MALAAILTSAVLMILPLTTTSTTYQWNPSDSADSGAVALDRSWPQSLEVNVTFRCSAIYRDILSTGGFNLYCHNYGILAKSGKTVFGPIHGSDGDSIRFTFDGLKGTAAFSNRSTHEWSSAKLRFKDFPVFHELNSLTPAHDGISVALTTRPSALDFDVRRWILAGFALLLAIGSALAFRVAPVKGEHHTGGFRRFWPQNIGVLGALSVSAMAIPMFYDDGWVIQRVTQYLQTGYLGDFYYHSNAWLPQGFLTEFILSAFIGAGANYLVLRLLVVLILWATWLVVVATARRIKRDLAPLAVWLSAAVFVAIAAVFGTSLRAESWVGLFTAACFYFIVRYLESNSTRHLFGAGAFAGLAAATHQSGFVAFVGFVVLAVYVLVTKRWRLSRELVVVVFAVIATTLAFFFVGYDLTTVISGARDFSDDAYSNRLDEFFRVGQIAGHAISGARRFAVLVVIAILALGIAAIRHVRGTNRQWLIILLLSPIGLLLTSSKWAWHVAVLAIPAALLAMLVIQFDKSTEEFPRLRFALILPAVAVLVGVSLASAGYWGSFDHSVLTWDRYSDKIAGPDTQWWWLGGAVVLAVIGAMLDRRSAERDLPRTLGSWIAILSMVVPVASSLAWVFADTYLVPRNTGLGWTVLGQNTNQLLNQGNDMCGSLGSDARYTTRVVPLDVNSPYGENTALLMRSSGTEGLGFDGVEGWATVPGDRSATSTRSYRLPAAHYAKDPYAIWLNIGKNDIRFEATITILAQGMDKTSVVRKFTVGDSLDSWTWSKVEFTVPTIARSVRVVVNSSAKEPIYVTQPVMDIRGSAQNVLAGGTVLVPPSVLPSVPCATLPSASGGLFPATPFVVLVHPYDDDSLLRYYPYTRVSITELNEVQTGMPAIGKAEYDNAGGLTKTAPGLLPISP